MILRQFLGSVLLTIGLQVGAGGTQVLVAKVDGGIGPMTAKFMIEAIDRAEQQQAECVVFELDTPGGLDDSMRAIIKHIMEREDVQILAKNLQDWQAGKIGKA